jgi:hypothetical protein
MLESLLLFLFSPLFFVFGRDDSIFLALVTQSQTHTRLYIFITHYGTGNRAERVEQSSRETGDVHIAALEQPTLTVQKRTSVE